MTKETIRKKLRIKLIQIAASTESAHPHLGSCLSCIDILIETLIYQMRKNDKFILSKGHASLALYVVLNYQKKLSNNILKNYFKDGTELGVHPPTTMQKDIPLATGSLGHGLSFAAGLALAYKLKNPEKPKKVYCLISDGECNEGSIWEAALFASHHKLNNLIVMVDKNGIQAFGRTNEVMGDAATPEKWTAFGFETIMVDGHSMKNLEKSFKKAKKMTSKPTMLICNTKRAKGIASLEDKLISNYMATDKKILTEALTQINSL